MPNQDEQVRLDVAVLLRAFSDACVPVSHNETQAILRVREWLEAKIEVA